MPQRNFQHLKGFTLIEVLVSMIILAIGLLGLASMQTLALKDNQDAFFYSQASSLAYEMSDRIKANTPTSGLAPWRQATIPSAAASCLATDACNSITGCTPAAMAEYDYCAWKQNVVSRIGDTASSTVTASGSSGPCSGGASKRCITISWARNKNLGNQTSTTFRLEITP